MNGSNKAIGLEMEQLVGGQIVASFSYESAGNWITAIQVFPADLSSSDPPILLATSPTAPAGKPVLTALSDGGFALLYRTDVGLFLDRYDSNLAQLPGYPVEIESSFTGTQTPFSLVEGLDGEVMIGFVSDNGTRDRVNVETVNEFGGNVFTSTLGLGFANYTDPVVKVSPLFSTVNSTGYVAVAYDPGTTPGLVNLEVRKFRADNSSITTVPMTRDDIVDFMLERLDNGNWLLVTLLDSGFPQEIVVEVLSDDFSVLESSSTLTVVISLTKLDHVVLDDGSIAVVAVPESSLAAGDYWMTFDGETGALVKSPAYAQSFNFGEDRDEPFDLMALDGGGFAIVREASNSSNGYYTDGQSVVTILNQGSQWADRTTLTSATEYDAGAANDRITGSDEDDIIMGGAGADTLTGNGGDDTLILDEPFSYGFGEFEVAHGGQGDDLIINEQGSAELSGGNGRDAIFGGTDADDINGDLGSDLLRGGGGDDTVAGGKNRDHVFGDFGNDMVRGGDGRDVVDGGGGNDTVRGGEGNDRTLGGDGNDLILGNAGNDTLTGGLGNDTMKGGLGNDVFKFTDDGLSGFGTAQEFDVILDFVKGEDTIKFARVTGVSGFSDLEIVQEGEIGVITAGGREISVMMTSGTLSDTDFSFV
ncbi:MAG: calcium-binding protein [Pseudomonadota bacterium]